MAHIENYSPRIPGQGGWGLLPDNFDAHDAQADAIVIEFMDGPLAGPYGAPPNVMVMLGASMDNVVAAIMRPRNKYIKGPTAASYSNYGGVTLASTVIHDVMIKQRGFTAEDYGKDGDVSYNHHLCCTSRCGQKIG